jgi:hypothetical protein
MAKPKIKSDGRTITVRVPISIRKRGGRKVVLAPDGSTGARALFCQRVDSVTVKAIARAFRWRDMLEHGRLSTIAEIAAAEAINASYVGRVLRLTLLAPAIVEEILDGKQSADMTLAALMEPFPIEWELQRQSAKLSTKSD